MKYSELEPPPRFDEVFWDAIERMHRESDAGYEMIPLAFPKWFDDQKAQCALRMYMRYQEILEEAGV